MNRGFQGLALKAFGAADYELTVTGARSITERFHRLSFDAGGILDQHETHPTQWIRLWIPNGEKVHQRGYTLVDPNPSANTFDIEFALHPGPTTDWVSAAQPGDVIDATVMGSKFTIPDPAPTEYLLFGDPASVPAINSLLEAIGDVPVRIWLEWQHESDRTISLHTTEGTQVTWVPRGTEGAALRDAAETLQTSPLAFAWVACEFGTTRKIVKSLKTIHNLPKSSIKSQAYWK